MQNSLKDLKNLWEKEKEHYKTTELGTGVQSFVKKIFESEELFSLKEGRLSTKHEQRKNEFIYEKKAKESRRADFYLYVSSEIAIPVEVERFENISAGEGQLLNYQKDFEKHYGILTDGFTWRFYNNNVYRIFTLEDLFERTQLFLTFWKEYIKPEFYYLSFFEKKEQPSFAETELHVEDNRQLFFEDITKLIRSFKDKLEIEGYLEEENKKAREKRAIELTYAYIIQFILYKTLVDNDFSEFSNEFESTVSKIHKSLNEKRYKDILGIIDGISSKISTNIYRPFNEEQGFIKDKMLDLYHSLENTLSDVSPWLDIFIFIKKYNFSNVKNEIFGYIYENYLKEIYEESKKGQYFTDPAVVNFMLNEIGYESSKIRDRYESDKNSISLIDPSSGSGTFLYSAVNEIVKAFHDGYKENASLKIEDIVTDNIFGLDIEEFPLYLAEMSILMRMLPLIVNIKYNNPIDKKIKVFKTNDSISEFRNVSLRNTLSDAKVAFHKTGGQIALFAKNLDLGYTSYMRDESDLKNMKESLENLQKIPRRRFDYVIGNPPYISYNECSKQGILIFKLMKQGKEKLNDIYGVNLHSVPDHQKKYAPKPNLYTFFIALGLALLKDEGKLCYIIPQTVLVNNDLDVLRYHLAKFLTIEKIITFRQKMFVGRGLRQNTPVVTSSLIFIVKKGEPDDLHKVKIQNYTDSEDELNVALVNIAKNKKVITNMIPQKKLLQSIGNWNFIKHGKEFIEFYDLYTKNTDNFGIYFKHVLAEQNFQNRFYFDGSINIPKKDIIRAVDQFNDDNYAIPSLKSMSYISGIDGQYPRNRKIKAAHGSQGIIVAEPRYKVLWKYINHDKFYYMEGNNILPIYQQYCIASNNKAEIFYLFSLLNSKTIGLILKSLFKVEQEDKLSFLLGLTSIKEFVRVPKINELNIHIKNEVVKLTDNLLNEEKSFLGDLVDIPEVLQQSFNKIYIDKDDLMLETDGQKLSLRIKEKVALVASIISAKYNNPNSLYEKEISLSELLSLQIIDFTKQQRIKNEIDNLVFCLYFNILIPEDKIADVVYIKSQCEKNKFYKLISSSKS